MNLRAITPNECPQTQKANYARKMYLKLGFEIVKSNEADSKRRCRDIIIQNQNFYYLCAVEKTFIRIIYQKRQ